MKQVFRRLRLRASVQRTILRSLYLKHAYNTRRALGLLRATTQQK